MYFAATVGPAPFGPRAVIKAVVFVARYGKRQREDGGSDAGAAGRDDGLCEVYAGGFEYCTNIRG